MSVSCSYLSTGCCCCKDGWDEGCWEPPVIISINWLRRGSLFTEASSEPAISTLTKDKVRYPIAEFSFDVHCTNPTYSSQYEKKDYLAHQQRLSLFQSNLLKTLLNCETLHTCQTISIKTIKIKHLILFPSEHYMFKVGSSFQRPCVYSIYEWVDSLDTL